MIGNFVHSDGPRIDLQRLEEVSAFDPVSSHFERIKAAGAARSWLSMGPLPSPFTAESPLTFSLLGR